MAEEGPLGVHDYSPEDSGLIRAALLHLMTYLGAFSDDLVLVGGMVPSLLVPASSVPSDQEAHPGTRDLDLGLSLALLEGERYEEIARALRRAGFQPDSSERGNLVRQRWRHERRQTVTVDFLILPIEEDSQGGGAAGS